MSRWLLVDGFNLAYRCFFATPSLARLDGFPTNALHGWIKSIWRLSDQERPDHTVVFFDLGGSRYRLALHPEYKAQRPEMPEALARQIPLVKDLTRMMGLAAVEKEGVESDDLLASCAIACADAGGEVIIVSSDKDFAQIVGDRVRILLPPPTAQPRHGWRTMGASDVKEKFGVSPNQMIDYLALIGDTSDNIPGLAGVGPKTAAKWLELYGDLEGVLAASDLIFPERFRYSLKNATERLRLNKRLVTLDISLELSGLSQNEPDNVALFAFLREMEMFTTLSEAQRRYFQTELF